MERFKTLLKKFVEREGSDLFLRTNSVPCARIEGDVRDLDDGIITLEEMSGMTEYLLSDERRKKIFEQQRDIDFAHYEDGVGRFRINIFIQRNSPALVARHVRTDVRSFEELNLPVEILEKFCQERSGLVLLTGPAGSGKSTTIASMINRINETSRRHIVTIEDPIEFIFEDNKSIINQRELGLDVPSYPAALKHVTQQSPDIIYIGTTRDMETMQALIDATELGTFVLTTFHTLDAVQTITRMVNFFPPYLHDEIRMQLSMILKGVISIRLLPRTDKSGRIPAYETMVVTPTIARLIRENKIHEIQSFIEEGDLFGMQSFKKCLVDLVKHGKVTEDDARDVALSKDDFNLELKGVKRYLK